MLHQLRAALVGISAYREVMDEPAMERMCALLGRLADGRGEAALRAYTEVFHALRREEKSGLGDWLDERLRFGEGPYPALVERGGQDPALEGAARRDIDTFVLLAGLDCDRLLEWLRPMLGEEFAPVLAGLPRWRAEAPFCFDGLTDFYRVHGCGVFAKYRAFVWDRGALIPVPEPDCPGEEELLGYTLQRDQVVANTRALLEGARVNDVLLYGDSGTGKSATVKSLLALPDFEALRLVEVQKDGVRDMPALIRRLGARRQKFVLFLDDLAFDQDDATYSVMKSILEGGLEKRPQNVAVYATSNRRLLVKQTFSARLGDEVDARETIQEKTALSDRFGLRIPYLSLSKPEWLDLAVELARRAGVETEEAVLRQAAVRWDIHVPGRTPRTANQFVAGLGADG